MRIFWLVFLLFLLAGLKFEKLKFYLLTYLFILRVFWNALIFLVHRGYVSVLAVRVMHAAVILAILLSIKQKKFCFRAFCLSISSKWSIVFATILLFCILSNVVNVELYVSIMNSIIGVSSNFSILLVIVKLVISMAIVR